MSLIIKKRPRNNIHVALFKELKKYLELCTANNVMNVTQTILEKHEKLNNFEYLFHVGKYDIIILDKDANEIIWFSVPQL